MFAQDSTLIGDVDCSGEVNSQDASLILQFVTNVIDELPCEANMTGLTPEELQEMIDMMESQLNINNLSVNNMFELECVDMGISPLCGALGLDPSATLEPSDGFNYDMGNSDNLVGNYILEPHWRKFKITGIGDYLEENGQLMFRCKYVYSNTPGGPTYPDYQYINPEIIDGEVYFYFYQTLVTNTSDCVSQDNIALSIPIEHAFNVYWFTGNSNSSFWSTYSEFEIYYQSNGSYKNTGIFFTWN